jgi:ATP-binding cassette subfamily C protein
VIPRDGPGVPGVLGSAWSSGRRLARLLPGRLRRGWLVAVVLAGLCSVAELATTAVVLGVIRLATQPGAAGPRTALPWAPADSGAWAALLTIALAGAVFAVRAALILGGAAASGASAVATGLFVGEALFSHYVWMPYARFRQRGVAELHRLVAHLANDVVDRVVRPGLQLLTDALLIAAVLAVMVIASPLGTLAAATLVAGLSLLLARLLYPALYRSSAVMDRHERSAYVFVEQVLHGRREITLRGHEAAVVDSYLDERQAVGAAARRRLVLLEVPRAVVEAATMTLVAGLLVGAVGLGLDTPGVVATLGLFAYALLRLVPLATRVTTNVSSIRAGLPILEAVMRDLEPALDRAHGAPSRPPGSVPAAPAIGPAIDLCHVWSSYDGARHPVLRDVSARIEPGTFVAIVGPSGAGKSTLVDLLLGLLAPTAGEILVDGRPLPALAGDWRARIGVVSQEPYIFNDTIARNVVLFAEPVDEPRVRRVLADVGLWGFVQAQRDGLATRVGERGSALSGGQRQRLAIARALYSDPDFLVFDEATSALDPDSEAAVLRGALREACPRTLVAVTHRASAIVGCDQVIVLDDGAVTAAGSWAEVSSRSPYFRRLIGARTPSRH